MVAALGAGWDFEETEVVGSCGGGTSDEIEGGWKEEVGSDGVIWGANSKCEKSLPDISFFSQIEHSVK